jgi:hypothetical protein
MKRASPRMKRASLAHLFPEDAEIFWDKGKFYERQEQRTSQQQRQSRVCEPWKTALTLAYC